MITPLSERTRDYIASKRTFSTGLRDLLRYMKAAGLALPTTPIIQTIEIFIAMSTEDFLNDPQAHYPGGHVQRYEFIMSREQELRGLEEKKLVPQGFAERALKEFVMVVRNQMRCLNADTPDEKIQYGLWYDFPHLVRSATSGLPPKK